MMFRFMLNDSGREQNNVDQPLSNYDVIGIPTTQWSSHLFACYENILPSCVVSFFCPCIMWAQIVVRAQIPLFVSLKNSFNFRLQTGYGCFVDYFFWSLAISIILLVVLACVHMPSVGVTLLAIVLIVVFGCLIFSIGHTRTAFREKYLLPGWFVGCIFWDMIFDAIVGLFCLPCVLSQMARHVFQYPRMDRELGLFVGDPSILPPLPPTDEEQQQIAMGTEFQRPVRADRAGLAWLEGGHHPDVADNTGRAHRQEEILRQQQSQTLAMAVPAQASYVYNHQHQQNAAASPSSPPMAAAVIQQQPTVIPTAVIYNNKK